MKVVFNSSEVREIILARVDELFDGQDVEVKFERYDDDNFATVTTKEVVDEKPLDPSGVPF